MPFKNTSEGDACHRQMGLVRKHCFLSVYQSVSASKCQLLTHSKSAEINFKMIKATFGQLWNTGMKKTSKQIMFNKDSFNSCNVIPRS